MFCRDYSNIKHHKIIQKSLNINVEVFFLETVSFFQDYFFKSFKMNIYFKETVFTVTFEQLN